MTTLKHSTASADKCVYQENKVARTRIAREAGVFAPRHSSRQDDMGRLNTASPRSHGQDLVFHQTVDPDTNDVSRTETASVRMMATSWSSWTDAHVESRTATAVVRINRLQKIPKSNRTTWPSVGHQGCLSDYREVCHRDAMITLADNAWPMNSFAATYTGQSGLVALHGPRDREDLRQRGPRELLGSLIPSDRSRSSAETRTSRSSGASGPNRSDCATGAKTKSSADTLRAP